MPRSPPPSRPGSPADRGAQWAAAGSEAPPRAAAIPTTERLRRWAQALPAEALQRCEDPLSRYNFGWSHGKESLASGSPDVNKGSFYANPLQNSVTDDPALIAAYPSYCRCVAAAPLSQN